MATGTGYRVLFVDEEEGPTAQYRNVLELAKFSVDYTPSVTECLEKFNPDDYSAVILDIDMPTQGHYTDEESHGGAFTGVCVARKMRESDERIPIIALSNMNASQIVEMDAHNPLDAFTRYCHKPQILPSQLAAMLRQMFHMEVPVILPFASQDTIDLFICHSASDAALAQALLDLIRDAYPIPPQRIRCSALPAYAGNPKHAAGADLPTEIMDASVFLLLETPVCETDPSVKRAVEMREEAIREEAMENEKMQKKPDKKLHRLRCQAIEATSELPETAQQRQDAGKRELERTIAALGEKLPYPLSLRQMFDDRVRMVLDKAQAQGYRLINSSVSA